MRVILIGVTTVCGRISPASMGSSDDRRHLETMRAATGASLIGAETLRSRDPEILGPEGSLIKDRIRAVITQSGRIPVAGKKFFERGPLPLVFTGREGNKVLRQKLAGRARLVVLPLGPAGGLSMSAAVRELAKLGAESILIEGGGRLNYAALQQGVVDEIALTIAPCLSGDRQAASLVDGPGPLAGPFLALEMISCRPGATGEIFVNYRVKRKN